MRKSTFAFLLLLWGQLGQAQFSADSVLTHADVMPFFPGCGHFPADDPEKRNCSNQALVHFIADNLRYPDHAKDAKVEGTVYVSFIVDETGVVGSPNLLVDIGGGCGEAALEVLNAMPNWEPARHQGSPVKVRLNLPVQFSLRNAVADRAEMFLLTWGDLSANTISTGDIARNLHNPICVRGPEGDNRYVDEVRFMFTRNNKSHQATARGAAPYKLGNLFDKIRKGGSFVVTASLQDDGQFISVSRTYEIVD